MPASRKAVVEIEYCIHCGFLLRAAWLAQELLRAFEAELEAVMLRPGSGGVLAVRLDGETLFSNREHGALPELKALKRRIGERIGSDRSFGHAEERDSD